MAHVKATTSCATCIYYKQNSVFQKTSTKICSRHGFRLDIKSLSEEECTYALSHEEVRISNKKW